MIWTIFAWQTHVPVYVAPACSLLHASTVCKSSSPQRNQRIVTVRVAR